MRDQMRPFSKRANYVLKLAQEAAQEYRQGYMGTEHLLLGIVREGTSLAAEILLDNGITEYKAKAMVDELVQERVNDTWVTGRLPGSPHFVDVFARSERIAERLGHAQICAEHLLVALTTQAGSVGCEVLRAMGISTESLENAFHDATPEASS